MLSAKEVGVVMRLQDEGRVGDGVKCTPALTQGGCRLTAVSGADVAMEAGDVTLKENDLTEVAAAIALCRATMRVMKQPVLGFDLKRHRHCICTWHRIGWGLLLIPVHASAGML
jgi:cation transport ATPase